MAIRVTSVTCGTWRTRCCLSRTNILIRATPVSTTLLHFIPGSIFGDKYLASFNSSAGVQSSCSNLKHCECVAVVHGDVYHTEHVSNRRSRLRRLPKKFSSAVSHRNGRSDRVHYSCKAQTHKVPQQYMYKRSHHPLLQCRHYYSSTLLLAGHNKWSKIKHKKKATDLEKSKNIQKYVTLIVSAIKTGGGPDPDANVRLASVIETARKAGIYGNHTLATYL